MTVSTQQLFIEKENYTNRCSNEWVFSPNILELPDMRIVGNYIRIYVLDLDAIIRKDYIFDGAQGESENGQDYAVWIIKSRDLWDGNSIESVCKHSNQMNNVHMTKIMSWLNMFMMLIERKIQLEVSIILTILLKKIVQVRQTNVKRKL